MAPLSEEESKAMRSVLVLVFFVVVALKIPGLKTNMYRKQSNFCASVFRILTTKKARTDIKKEGGKLFPEKCTALLICQPGW